MSKKGNPCSRSFHHSLRSLSEEACINPLPFRLRPAYNPEYSLYLRPYKFTDHISLTIGAHFPSDHAVLFFALGNRHFFLVSKKSGCPYRFVYFFYLFSFPGSTLDFTYPTDILAGAAIGILITYAVSQEQDICSACQKTAGILLTTHRDSFYAIFLSCFISRYPHCLKTGS
jgi:undecaprenyl-diphosphatase